MDADLIVIGAGAAGLAAAIFAGEAARGTNLRIVLLDGARKPGAKILVSGGGRCNVTNDVVRAEDYHGGRRTIIKRTLKAFDEKATVRWLRSLGVILKTEETGKLFPVTDSARTVLGALLNQVRDLGVEFRHPMRVQEIRPMTDGHEVVVWDPVAGQGASMKCRRVIIATGGLSLPRSGSDGWGISEMQRLGHVIVPTTPALSPLLLAASDTPGGRFAELAGVTFDGRLRLCEPTGKVLEVVEGSLLFTHFGLSGPASLDFSRHWLRWVLEHDGQHPVVQLGMSSIPTVDAADEWLMQRVADSARRSVVKTLADVMPSRAARLIAEEGLTFASLTKHDRRRIAVGMAALPIEVTGERGYSFAETTAGGVDLSEVEPRTFESRRVPGLHIIGEMLDVDGRIGGFNFQWAWATGYLAGNAAVKGLVDAKAGSVESTQEGNSPGAHSD